jgi:sugar/nucleoside kinase (ribokinase family)
MELAERSARDAAAGRSFDYVTVGHVTVDVIAADGSRRPGGGAFYSALQAARLGLRTLILTQGSASEIEALLEPYRSELELRIIPATATTTLETSWSGAVRTQRLLAWAEPIVETIEVDTQVLHFAPVARETSAAWAGHADFVGLTPQGLARTWGEDGESAGTVVAAHLPSDRGSLEKLLPDGCSAVVVSEQERVACAPLLDAAAEGGAVLAITAGAGATSVCLPDGEVIRVPAPSVDRPRDDLGAGDVFAAAFFIALREGQSPVRAAGYGNAAAAIRIEGVGAQGIGNRQAIEARLADRKPKTSG